MKDARRISLIAWLATLAACGTWLASAGTPLIALFALPLLLPLPGMFAGRHKSFVWGGAMALPYLALAIAEIIATPDNRILPALTLAPGLLFVALLPAAARANSKSSSQTES